MRCSYYVRRTLPWRKLLYSLMSGINWYVLLYQHLILLFHLLIAFRVLNR